MVVIILSPNTLLELVVDCAVFAKAPPKIEAAVLVADEALAVNATNELEPKRPLPASN